MSFLARFTPAVPRRWLFAIAGVLWTTAGGILWFRALTWLDAFGPFTEASFLSVAFAFAVPAYLYGFSKAVDRNINRIHNLPERVSALAFTAWKGYFMIGGMIALGIALRSSEIPKYYLSMPYACMGVLLIFGSWRYYSQFLTSGKKKPKTDRCRRDWGVMD